MAPKKKRRTYSRSPVRFHSWEHHDHQDTVSAKLEASNKLEGLLITLYASGKLDAKALCTLCHWCVLSGCCGSGIKRYAVAPDKASTGAYKRHLDTVLPVPGDAPHLESISVPMWIKNR
eukprot:6459204-Pyramimonas_sp.AAC.1